MGTHVIQAKYDELESIARFFGQLTERNAAMSSNLRQGVERLQRGDWIGKGSDAFFKEMGDEVLPAVERLIHALQQSQSTINEIIFVIQQAEEEAARPFTGGTPELLPASTPGGNGQPAGEEGARPEPTPVLFQSPAQGKSASPTSAKPQTPTARERLESAYNIKIEKGDKDWSDQEIKHLEKALSSLSNEEKKVLRGYHFIRWSSPAERMKVDRTFKEAEEGEGGRHEMDLNKNSFKISMYDKGFADPEATRDEAFGVDKGQFTILHEIGHAMSGAELRNKFEAREPWADSQSRAETDVEKLMKGREIPSEYAKTNKAELFAEMFAIYKADPKFLKAHYPKVFEYFQNGKYVKK